MTINEAFGTSGLEIERNTSTEKQIASLKKNISKLKAERDEWKARVDKAESALIDCADYCLMHKLAEPGIVLKLLKIHEALAGKE